ncbi:MAG: hypothetical protein PHD25_09620 [Bacteroidales bacterium]|nr:hypothetical protein [Bacteroidales bacterium]
MKKFHYLLFAVLAGLFVFQACEKDEDETPEKKVVNIGAQANATTGGFYSVSENKVYTLDNAFNNQSVIDIFCFYEAKKAANNIAVASPGTGIDGIFSGSKAPENWTVQNTTFFCATTLTVAQFDALEETDELIVTSFVEDNAYRKAKDLKVNDIYSFKTESEAYGLFKVTQVVQGSTGSVTFEVKVKK